MDKHFMIDIETTGVNKAKDHILQVAALELHYAYPYWHIRREINITLHYGGQPETPFAKDHMAGLYKECNETTEEHNYDYLRFHLKKFIHGEDFQLRPVEPKYFMGWNASGFDIPFLAAKEILLPSYYEVVNNKDKIRGDVHYRVYEQTGALNYVCDMSGLDRKTVQTLAMDFNPTMITMPEGKEHNALYDCYKQVILMNGLICIGRKGVMK